jgi:hypothetical protein
LISSVFKPWDWIEQSVDGKQVNYWQQNEDKVEEIAQVRGSTIQSFYNICINLEFIAEPDLYNVIKDINDPNDWYPFQILTDLFDLIEKKYKNSDVFFEQIGEETMRLWYEKGEGRHVISKGVDFLKYQAGAKGYKSMVKGPVEVTGEFLLNELNESEGTASLSDTSPFHYAYVKGIIIGGMRGGGDLRSIDVQYTKADRSFFIRYQ